MPASLALGVQFNDDATGTFSVFGDLDALSVRERDALARWLEHFARAIRPVPAEVSGG